MIKNLFYLAALTFTVIVSWILFGVYHNHTTSTISSDTNILITPIPAKFDDEVIRKISTRHVIGADLDQKPSGASATPTLIPSPTSTVNIPNSAASGSAEL